MMSRQLWSVSISLNRNILECKSVAGGVDYAASVVLIETYWNVNVTWVVMGIMLLVVLIETYWNVNYVENITIKNLSKS